MHVRTNLLAIVSLALTFALATDTASPDDPNEISFSKGEVMDIIDKTGKWWQARKDDGSVGSMYSLLAPSHLTEPRPQSRHRIIFKSSDDDSVRWTLIPSFFPLLLRPLFPLIFCFLSGPRLL
jgi:SH3 domain